MRNLFFLALGAVLVVLLSFIAAPGAKAAGDAVPPPNLDWSFEGVLGTYDKAALQRGLKVYREVCAACHSMKRIAFRNLSALGYSEAQIKAIAASYTIQDGPNDEGEMFDRPGLPSDRFPSPYPNDKAARAVNNGALPPDLSLITKARAKGSAGADYVKALLVGYQAAPEGKVLLAGQHWNTYMPGHVIAMAQPFTDGQVAYDDGSPETVEQYSRDIAHFLTWAAEPELEQRKKTGFAVILFLIVFAGVMYAVKRKLWADLKK